MSRCSASKCASDTGLFKPQWMFCSPQNPEKYSSARKSLIRSGATKSSSAEGPSMFTSENCVRKSATTSSKPSKASAISLKFKKRVHLQLDLNNTLHGHQF